MEEVKTMVLYGVFAVLELALQTQVFLKKKEKKKKEENVADSLLKTLKEVGQGIDPRPSLDHGHQKHHVDKGSALHPRIKRREL